LAFLRRRGSKSTAELNRFVAVQDIEVAVEAEKDTDLSALWCWLEMGSANNMDHSASEIVNNGIYLNVLYGDDETCSG